MTSRASWTHPTTGRATSSSQRTWRYGLRRGACPAPGHPRQVLRGHLGRAAPRRPRRQPTWRGRWISPGETGLGGRPRRCLRPIDGPLARVRGERAEAASCDRAATHPQGVWIFVRASSRAVLEQGTLPRWRAAISPAPCRARAPIPTPGAPRPPLPPRTRWSPPRRPTSEPHARPADASAPQRSRARARASRLAMKGTTQIRQYGVLASLKRLGEAGGESGADRGRSRARWQTSELQALCAPSPGGRCARSTSSEGHGATGHRGKERAQRRGRRPPSLPWRAAGRRRARDGPVGRRRSSRAPPAPASLARLRRAARSIRSSSRRPERPMPRQCSRFTTSITSTPPRARLLGVTLRAAPRQATECSPRQRAPGARASCELVARTLMAVSAARARPICRRSHPGDQPVLRRPVAIPFTVSSSARCSSGSTSSWARRRARSSTWSTCIGRR